MTNPVEKCCERCGRRFSCGQYGCWCGQLNLTDRQFDWIAARYQDCLCPDCLAKIAAGETGPGRIDEKHGQTDEER